MSPQSESLCNTTYVATATVLVLVLSRHWCVLSWCWYLCCRCIGACAVAVSVRAVMALVLVLSRRRCLCCHGISACCCCVGACCRRVGAHAVAASVLVLSW